jgi:NAD(P)H-hydrate epimerase
MPGAAILVARAAQRAGAGLVAVGCLDPALLAIVPPAAPEAVLVDLRAAFTRSGGAGEGAAELFRSREPHALVVGPGLGDERRTRELVRLALETQQAPLVLDADALNALDGEPERLRAAPQRLSAMNRPIVITPHPGEAARLAGRAVPRDAAGRLAFARELAARSNAIVCLKGRATVVADAGGDEQRVFVNTTGNPGMATAGAGDVLAGILVAYLAALGACPEPGWTPFAAAASAVWVHGLAGDLAAERLGRRALIASDLVDALSEAQQRLEALPRSADD